MLEPFDGDKLVDPNYRPPANTEGSSSAPPTRTAFTVEPFVGVPTRFAYPMSWPQYNGSQETGLSGSTMPHTEKTRQSIVSVPQAGYSSKLARMNAPPPTALPRPPGASSPSTMLSVGDRASSADPSGSQQDLSTLVNQLVNDALRQHGTVPPEYEESVAPRVESRLSLSPV